MANEYIFTEEWIKEAHCLICMGPAEQGDGDCVGLLHQVESKSMEIPVEEIQAKKFGAYVDPKTGKIVKAKALNNPMTLGKE